MLILLLIPKPVRGLVVMLTLLLIGYLIAEVIAALRGERRWRMLVDARTKVFWARDHIERDFRTRASNRSFHHKQFMLRAGYDQHIRAHWSETFLWPEQKEAIDILWQACYEINEEMKELDLPFWRKPRL